MNRDVVLYILCPECGARDLLLEVYTFSEGDQIIEGCLTCSFCSNWFRIENGIIDLLPMQLRRQNPERFMVKKERFAIKYGLPLHQAKDNSQLKESTGKTKPIGALEDVPDYEQRVVNNPYYQALDRIVFYEWVNRNLHDQDLVLDIGCGTGRQCIPLAERQIRTIGVDIDEEMLEVANEKISKQSLDKFVDFVVGDGENPPVRSENFTACVLYGVLHHLSDKFGALTAASSKLVPGGKILTLDPHKSFMRFAFDFLMRVKTLYIEEASDDPLITEDQLNKWMTSNNIDGEIWLSTFIPPHIFLGKLSTNIKLLKISDVLFNRIPLLRKAGGVIIYEGKKINSNVALETR